jgi:hypothetical protein
MSALGTLVELLHNAHDRVHAFEAELLDRTSPSRSIELIVNPVAPPAGRFRWQGAGPWPHVLETRRRLWFERPDRLRIEISCGGVLLRIGVRNGAEWWRWDRENGVTEGNLTELWATPLLDPPLLSPARLMGWLRLEPSGVGERAGRRVLIARASPRALPLSGADQEFELEFDAEHGTMLRRATLEEGQLIRLAEALSVRYDAPVDPVRFEFAIPEWRSDVELPPHARR